MSSTISNTTTGASGSGSSGSGTADIKEQTRQTNQDGSVTTTTTYTDGTVKKVTSPPDAQKASEAYLQQNPDKDKKGQAKEEEEARLLSIKV